jgi:methionyl-tRNA synthetase
MNAFDLKNALQSVFSFADSLNIYLAEQEPWKIKGEDPDSKQKIESILFTV